MKVVWTDLADLSYDDELDFIYRKWTFKEVNDFMDLVDEFIKQLESGILSGKVSPKTNMRSFVISKQTTVYFDYYEDRDLIELLLFWNNQKDPLKLKEFL